MEKTTTTLDISGKTLTLEVGRVAMQATSAVLARLGDTMVLATVVAGSKRADIDYFPLTVEYIERLYAGGRIKGSRWVKREGRPSDDSILIARLIDRSIRPLFPKEYKNEVQVVVTVLSVDGENEPDILSIIAVSAALSISHIPWNGPVSAVRMGSVKEKENGNIELIVNPGRTELGLSDLDMVVTQTKEKTLMLEAGAIEISEEVAVSAIEKAMGENKRIIALITDFVKKVGQKKEEVTPDTLLSETITHIEKTYKEEVAALIPLRAGKEGSSTEHEDLINKIFDEEKMSKTDTELDKKTVAKALEHVLYKIIRENVLKTGKRPDGRKVDEIREIKSDVSVLPRTHGSGLFQRGTTQALTVVTLGSPRLEQLIESAEGEEAKRYMHHYSMPPYSVGEVGRMGVPSRREIGHGALAERALLPVIPKQEKFPYTIRVVSEILSSNGSTSMAATCGSTLALMDAGVPIERPIAGVAMGMMSNDSKHALLTDILGLEDFSGDMDFKVAGSEIGITAIQLDVKIPGLTLEQIAETLKLAKEARLFILEKMLSVLPKSRVSVSTYAPKIELVKIPTDKIGEVIGPGGRVIRNIIATTGATVDVEDDGTVTVSGTDEGSVTKAAEWVRSLTKEVSPGEIYEGEVKRILPFGAFVEILPGKEGMVHVSQMAQGFVKDPADVVAIGQKVKVKVIEIDQQGRVNLTMLLEGVKEGGQQGPGPLPQVRRTPSEHPLVQQFRRERMGEGPARGGPGGRPGGPRRGFRKSHY